MITALVILLVFGGGFGGKTLNLSDPTVMRQFSENVGQIVTDPGRAANVVNAIYQLNIMSTRARQPNGLIEKEIQDLRMVAGSYQSTPADMQTALRELEMEISRVNQYTVDAREVIRTNTTKKEWKKLLKNLSE